MQFECSICLEEFNLDKKIPMVLPCGHTYCLTCIQGFKGGFCPNDRITFQNYSKNFTLLNIIENKNEIISKIKTEGVVEKFSREQPFFVLEEQERTQKIQTSFKIIFVGSDFVGKTSMIFRFIHNQFMNQRVTVGTDVKNLIEKHDGQRFKFRFWDSVGQEKYKSMSKISYQNADLAILVFSFDDIDSLQDIQNYWLQQVKAGCPNSLICLIGNKLDLKYNNNAYKIIDQTLIKSIQKNCFLFRQISCKTGGGIKQTWHQLSNALINRYKKKIQLKEPKNSFQEKIPLIQNRNQNNITLARKKSKETKKNNTQCC